MGSKQWNAIDFSFSVQITSPYLHNTVWSLWTDICNVSWIIKRK